MTGKMTVDTRLIPFSANYRVTEFDLDVYDGETVQISRGRYEDIEHWWGGADLPVVLKIDDRRYTPEPDPDVDYEVLRLPEYMMPSDWGLAPEKVMSMVPSEQHTRLITGI